MTVFELRTVHTIAWWLQLLNLAVFQLATDNPPSQIYS